MSLNRVAHRVWSRPPPPSDAARQVFSATGRGINWPGSTPQIDAWHPALASAASAGPDAESTLPPRTLAGGHDTRERTFDFFRLRLLLSDPATRQNALERTIADADEQRSRWQQLHDQGPAYFDGDGGRLASDIQRGVSVPWDLVIPFIEIPHTADYSPPLHDHGTHVAGILAGRLSEQDVTDWPADESAPDDICGMCPEIGLYDFRVFTDTGDSDEFTLVAALQYLRHLNAQHDQLLIHGANLSFSLRLDFASYACGRTPICEECDRTVNSGVVVVAAAGNQGGSLYTDVSSTGQAKGSSVGYRAISITDPGNAALVITVGATHASYPHAYGRVSSPVADRPAMAGASPTSSHRERRSSDRCRTAGWAGRTARAWPHRTSAAPRPC